MGTLAHGGGGVTLSRSHLAVRTESVLALAFLALACGCQASSTASRRSARAAARESTEREILPPRWGSPPVRATSSDGSLEVRYPAFLDQLAADGAAWLRLRHETELGEISVEFLRGCPEVEPAALPQPCLSPPCVLEHEECQMLLVGGRCIESGQLIYWWDTTPAACARLTFTVDNHRIANRYQHVLIRDFATLVVPRGLGKPPAPPTRQSGAAPASRASLITVHPCPSHETAEFAADLEKLCEQGDTGKAGNCGALAEMYLEGKGVVRDPARAAALFKRACEGNQPWRCLHLASLYEKGEGVARDPQRAVHWIAQACERGISEACARLGTMYRRGRHVPRDAGKALELLRRACNPGPNANEFGCAELGQMHELGEGVPVDLAMAWLLYRKACEDYFKPTGCALLGSMHERGVRVPKNLGQAVELYRKACTARDAAGCFNLGRLTAAGEGVPKDAAWARVLLYRACLGGEAEGCVMLGRMHGAGEGGPQDPVGAKELLKRACELGHAPSCSAPQRRPH